MRHIRSRPRRLKESKNLSSFSLSALMTSLACLAAQYISDSEGSGGISSMGDWSNGVTISSECACDGSPHPHHAQTCVCVPHAPLRGCTSPDPRGRSIRSRSSLRASCVSEPNNSVVRAPLDRERGARLSELLEERGRMQNSIFAVGSGVPVVGRDDRSTLAHLLIE